MDYIWVAIYKIALLVDNAQTAGGSFAQGTSVPGETTTHEETRKAIHDAEALLAAAQQLLPTLSIF